MRPDQPKDEGRKAAAGRLPPAPIHSGLLTFPVTPDLVAAASYVKANWPRFANAPMMDLQSDPITISFSSDSRTISDLQQTLAAATRLEGRMARSARAFKMALEARLKGRLIRRVEPPETDTLVG
jgi:hypothetical protein